MTPPGQIRRLPPAQPPAIQPANNVMAPAAPIVQALFPEDIDGPVFPAPPPFQPPAQPVVPPVGDPVGIMWPQSVQHPPTNEMHNAIADAIAAIQDLESLIPGWHVQLNWAMGPRIWTAAHELTGTGSWDNPIVVDDDE